MKATAKSNIKYNDTWYHAGDVFEVNTKDIASFGNLIEIEKAIEPEPSKIVVEKAKPIEPKKSKAKVDD